MPRLTPAALAAWLLLTLVAVRCQPAPAGPPHIALVLDVSASMAGSGADGQPPKIEATRQAATAMLRFFAGASPIPRVSLIALGDDPEVLYPLTNNMEALVGALATLPARVGGGTNIGAALETALRQLAGVDRGMIVLISDGLPTQGLAAEEIIDGPAQEVRRLGGCFYTLLPHDPRISAEGAAFLRRLREVAPCPEAEKILSLADAPRLLWAVTLARQTPPGSGVLTFSGRLEPGGSASAALVAPGPGAEPGEQPCAATSPSDDGAETRVVAVSSGAPVQLSLSTFPGQHPLTGTVGEAPGLSRLFAPGVAPVCSTLEFRNPAGTEVTYFALVVVLPRPVAQTDLDTQISIAVVVVVIVAVGLTVIAVERFRPRPGAYLIDVHAGACYPLPRSERKATHIGSAPDCDIILGRAAVTPHHALIRYARGRYYLQDRTGAGRTRLNGSPVDARALVHGDRVSIGSAEFQFRQEMRAARPPEEGAGSRPGGERRE